MNDPLFSHCFCRIIFFVRYLIKVLIVVHGCQKILSMGVRKCLRLSKNRVYGCQKIMSMDVRKCLRLSRNLASGCQEILSSSSSSLFYFPIKPRGGTWKYNIVYCCQKISMVVNKSGLWLSGHLVYGCQKI